MLSFTKTVDCSVIGTAQQIETKLMHRFEKFLKNFLAEFYSEGIYFSDTYRATTEQMSKI